MLIIILFLYKDIMKYKESSLFSYQCHGYFRKKLEILNISSTKTISPTKIR